MYVKRNGETISTVVPGARGCSTPQVLTMKAQRRFTHMRGLGGLFGGSAPEVAGAMLSRSPAARSGGVIYGVTSPLSPFTTPGTIVTPVPVPVSPVGTPLPLYTYNSRSFGPRFAPTTPTTGTAITPTTPTAPAVPGSPVPQNYPINQLYVDSSGNTWEYNSSAGDWFQISTTTSSSPSGYISNTNVPVGTPTNAPYVDTRGNIWTYNPYAGTWIETSVVGTASTTGAYNQGTPVPVGYPTNEAFTDSQGNVWTYSPVTGMWVESSSYTTALSAATAGSALPAGYVIDPSTGQPVLGTSIDPATGVSYAQEAANAATPSSTSTLLSWFTQQTLITGVPNWIIAAAAGFAALKLSQGRGR
jgi:hypothetical protein